MRKLNEIEIYIINIQIGCVLRLARLKHNLSQYSLGMKLDYNPTMIGRIERFENISSWDKILNISRCLDVSYNDLFTMKDCNSLLEIVNQSYDLEEKLTQEKEDYYIFLRKTIKAKFKLLENEK